MRNILLGAAALILGVSLTGTASAHEPYRHHDHHHHHHQGHWHGYKRSYYGPTPYYAKYGRPYGSGYYYAGRNHSHWEQRVWSVTYKRYHYYDPYACCYYYYSPERCGYYPVP